MPGTELLLLADATSEIGAGHAMRCAALAEAWRDLRLGPVVLSGRVSIPFVRARLGAAGVDIVSRAETAQRGRVVLVDGYDPALREQALKTPGALHVVVDDVGDTVPVGFDVIWNPNAYGNSTMYPAFSGSVLTGRDAVPVRGDLPTWRSTERTIGVSLGGGTLPAVLRAAVEALPSRCLDWTVYGVGAWSGNVRSIPAEDPWPTLVKCDRLLVGSGTTVWESAAVGIPVALVQTADNQARIFAWARSAGVPGVSLAEDGTQDLPALLARAVMGAAQLPQIRNGAPAAARHFARLASGRLASP